MGQNNYKKALNLQPEDKKNIPCITCVILCGSALHILHGNNWKKSLKITFLLPLYVKMFLYSNAKPKVKGLKPSKNSFRPTNILE